MSIGIFSQIFSLVPSDVISDDCCSCKSQKSPHPQLDKCVSQCTAEWSERSDAQLVACKSTYTEECDALPAKFQDYTKCLNGCMGFDLIAYPQPKPPRGTGHKR